jgi:DNA-binding response OmpR family regulator
VSLPSGQAGLPSGQTGPEKWRILLVDDDLVILELLTMRLGAQGYEVQTAADGEKAYALCPQFRPHLILCDIVMPKMDGPTLCRRLREENNNVPFLFLTAKGQPRDKVEALSSGGDDYVVKPFDPKELSARISAVLRRHYPRGSERQAASSEQ